MRTVALIAAALALLAAPAARAEIYTFSDWGPGFGSWHYDPGQPRGGPLGGARGLHLPFSSRARR